MQSSGRDEVTGANVLVALFSERESHAVYFLQVQDMTRLDAVNFIAHGIAKAPGRTQRPARCRAPPTPEEPGEKEEKPRAGRGQDALSNYCVNLNKKAQPGKIDPLIGRDAEIERTIQILCRRTKNNPLYVGDPGVGKTAIAEGLAKRIVEGDVPEVLLKSTIFALDMGSAARRHPLPRRLRGAAEGRGARAGEPARLDPVHRRDPHGDRRRRDLGGAMDASNLLKPALAQGTLRCIGSTTYKEYRNYFEKDRALVRRFQKIDVNEPTVEDAIKILQGLKTNYEKHHKVRYTPEAIRAAVELSAQYIHDRKLPDKAIDVIDEVGAARMLLPENKRRKTVTLQGRRGDRRQDRPHPAEERLGRRQGDAAQPRARPEVDGVRPGQGDRRAGGRDQAGPRRAARSRRSRSATTCSPARPASARPRWRGSSPRPSASS